MGRITTQEANRMIDYRLTHLGRTATRVLQELQEQVDKHVPVRTYSTVEELRATCQVPRCTLHLGHSSEHYDGILAVEVAS